MSFFRRLAKNIKAIFYCRNRNATLGNEATDMLKNLPLRNYKIKEKNRHGIYSDIPHSSISENKPYNYDLH